MSGGSDPVDGRARVHVHVSGRVQGVAYRAATRRRARTAGVDGWVQNLDDGRVEAVFEGPAAAVELMIEWCDEGSRAARVDSVAVTDESPGGLDCFEVRR